MVASCCLPSTETGADVLVALTNSHRIGVRVTIIPSGDIAVERKIACGAETRTNSSTAPGAQNDVGGVLSTIERSVSRKALNSGSGFHDL
jgi:hypothetical protein